MRYLIACFALVLGFNSFGGIEQYSDRLEGADIGTLPLEVYDARYFEMSIDPTWSLAYTNYGVSNKVTLGYIENDFPIVDESTSVTVEVTWWEYITGSGFVQVTETRTLSLEYFSNETAFMDDKSTFIFENGHRISINVLSSTGPLDHIYLETNIDVERYYTMNQTTITDYGFNAINYNTGPNGLIPSQLQDTDPVTTIVSNYYDPRLVFWWERIVGAEEYELEWTFISNHDYNYDPNNGPIGPIVIPSASLEFDFYENSTRVHLSENFYEIPGLFNQGYIVYRVRPIGRQGSEFEYRLEGDWSYGEMGTVSNFSSGVPNGVIQIGADFESGKNWSHSVSYAEEGKRFESVAYSDGMGRTRQSLGHNTATDQVVINNAYFDKVGRPIIGDLPTPDDREDFSFRKYFNYIMVAGSPEPMNLDNYMIDADNCVLPNPFSVNHGTGRYYSSQNPDKDGANAHIPDANGYPFSKAVYRDDPTGRMREVGGFGLELQPTQHSTKMFYDTPTQEELNRLFGTEVGWAQHYQKTITLDANGQAYIQYTDLAGRVVATGLAGDSPSNLTALDNNDGSSLVQNTVYTAALDNNQALEIAEYSYNRTILKDNEVITFTHEFDPAIFNDLNCINGICFDCHYDFDITVTRIDCPSDPPVIYSVSQTMSGEAINEACGLTTFDSPQTFSTPPLIQGEYVISKSLKVSEGVAEAYWCEYIDNAIVDAYCAPDFNAIYNNLYDNTDFGCEPFNGTINQNLSYCDFKRKQLASDMAVGGQYGLVSDANGGIDVTIHPLSIYNSINWQDLGVTYENENGSAAIVYVIPQAGGGYSPSVVTGAIVQQDQNNQFFVIPNYLANIEDFIFYSQPSWGDALVSQHPEYCYLQFCEQYGSDYHVYSEELDNILTYDQACTGGYFEPLGNTTITVPAYSGCANPLTEDAFFTSGYFTGTTALWAENNYSCVPIMDYSSTSTLNQFHQIDDNGVINYLSLWEYAVWQISCLNETSYSNIISCVNSTILDDCNKELIWQTFKQEYTELREQAYLFAQTAYVSYPDNVAGTNFDGGGCGNSHNGCIGGGIVSGVNCFDPFKYQPGNIGVVQNTPCDAGTSILYRDKFPRFNNFYDPQNVLIPSVLNLNDPSNVQNYLTSEIITACESSCEDQADGWMETLAACVDPNSQDYIDIKAGFIEVCQANCASDTSLFGASDLTGAPVSITANGYSSFEDVLQAVLQGNYNETADCSSLLISSPAPYGANPLQITQSPLDDCACDKVLEARLDFSVNTDPSITSVADQLMINEGVSYDIASSLACACAEEYESSHNGTPWSLNATWNSTSIANLEGAGLTVPTALSCNIAPCLDCSTFNTLYADFILRFGTDVELHANYETLLENYMNFGLAYNLTADHYTSFLEVCNASSTDPSCVIEPVTLVLIDMIDVLIRRGKLTESTEDIADNIVYENSTIGQFFNGTSYASSINGNGLEMEIGDANISLFLPAGADFDFDDILSVYDFTPISCAGVTEFTLIARIMKCGQIEEVLIDGKTNDFDLFTCYCGQTTPELCNTSSSIFISNDCYIDELIAINSISLDQYQESLNTKRAEFIANYTAQCASAFETETLKETRNENNYQFTLFYYDQAGNLIQTVAPEGVHLDFKNTPAFVDIDDDRKLENPNIPDHNFKTVYEYNSYNQLVSTTNPDQDGNTRFWYDRYGRIIASQNPVQAPLQYSYSLYDEYGRPVEVGQIDRLLLNGSVSLAFTETQIKQDDLGAWFKNWVYSGVRSEVTITKYDEYPDALTPTKFKQSPSDENLRLRVAAVRYYSVVSDNINYNTDFESASYYSYDQHGNVIEQIQDIPMMAVVDQDIKSTQYKFELISGNVSKVLYQDEELDFIQHEYDYDEMNRLTEVYTSTDKIHRTREAHYHYFDYGPLARIEIGQHKVQGQDFAYTINGWLKALNGSSLNLTTDIGKDAYVGYTSGNAAAHGRVARDVNAYTIGYFSGDYSPIESSSGMEMTSVPGDQFVQGADDLFNGNIRHLVTSIHGMETLGTAYDYDQLQRLKEMTAYKNLNTDNSWTDVISVPDYYNAYSYDKNGNIEALQRNGTVATGLLMDQFAYKYRGLDDVLNPSSTSKSNRLDQVIDNAVDDGSVDPEVGDIKFGMDPWNYDYDEIGQLISDVDEGISNIKWRKGDKKIQKITRNQANTSNVEFIYNPFGIRVLKIEKPLDGAGTILGLDEWKYTYYSHDANGQCMAVYDVKLGSTVKEAFIDEHHLYGASRLGMLKERDLLFSNVVVTVPTTDIVNNTLGERRYELANHLGNVQAVITDRKTWNLIDLNFEAVVVMTSDYYPFGMQMPGRHTEQESYRYAYNGMEVDNEVSGNGNSYTTEFRQYDPRLGRWKSLDPLMAELSHQSPFCAFDNNPVLYTDVYGLKVDDWYEDTEGNKKWKPSKEKTIIDVGSNGDVEVWTNIGEQLTAQKAGTSSSFSLFKLMTNYGLWTDKSAFDHTGFDIYNENLTPPMVSYYYHPLMDQMKGTPSEDRITSNESNHVVAEDRIDFNNFSDAMMGALIGGEGPENFYFGPASEVSSSMVNTQIVDDAVKDFQRLNKDIQSGNAITPVNWKHYSQTGMNASLSTIGAVMIGNDPTTPANFIGGASIRVTPIRMVGSDVVQVQISIHNVTSVGSGNVNNGQSFPRPLNESSAQPYTNISQRIDIITTIQL